MEQRLARYRRTRIRALLVRTFHQRLLLQCNNHLLSSLQSRETLEPKRFLSHAVRSALPVACQLSYERALHVCTSWKFDVALYAVGRERSMVRYGFLWDDLAWHSFVGVLTQFFRGISCLTEQSRLGRRPQRKYSCSGTPKINAFRDSTCVNILHTDQFALSTVYASKKGALGFDIVEGTPSPALAR